MGAYNQIAKRLNNTPIPTMNTSNVTMPNVNNKTIGMPSNLQGTMAAARNSASNSPTNSSVSGADLSKIMGNAAYVANNSPTRPMTPKPIDKPDITQDQQIIPTSQEKTPAPPQTTTPNNGIDKNALQAEAAARFAKLRAGVEGAVTSGKASRTNLKEYNDRLTQGNRALQNFDNSQRGDIFGGSAREDRFRLQRSQGIDDTFTNNAYTNDINTLDNQLTSFDSMAEEQQQTLFNDLLRQEREYGLQVGTLTGQFQGQQTLAAKSQEQNYGLGVAGLTGQYNGQRTIAGQQLDINKQTDQRNFDYGVGRDTVLDNRYEKQLDRNNFESDRSYTLAKSGQEWGQLMQKETFDFNKAQSIWDNNFKDKSFQQSMNEAAAGRGLQWANIGQRDKEFIADQAFKEKSYAADQTQRGIDNKYRTDQAEWKNNPLNPSNAPKAASYKEDPDFKSDASNMVKNPLAARTELRDNAQAYIDKYGMDGYNALISVVNR